MLNKYQYGNFIEEEYLLDCGLKVLYFPYPDYHTNYVGFLIPNGSDMADYLIDGKKVKTGIAHFLEHRMFDSPTGDMMNKFASLGADVNAFTEYYRTVYYYSTTSNSLEPFKLLFSLVTNFYSTDQAIENEKKIILEESKMRQANPFGAFILENNENLFIKNVLKTPIIGYKEDILSTNYDDLKTSFDTFYSLDRMVLLIIGPNPIKIYLDYINQESKKILKKSFDLKKDDDFENFNFIKKNPLIVKKEFSDYVHTLSFKVSYSSLKEKLNDYQFDILSEMSLNLLFGKSGKFFETFSKIKKIIPDSLQYSIQLLDDVVEVNILFYTLENDESSFEEGFSLIKDGLSHPSKYISSVDIDVYKKTTIMNDLTTLTNLETLFEEVLFSYKKGYNYIEKYLTKNDFLLNDICLMLQKIAIAVCLESHLLPK